MNTQTNQGALIQLQNTPKFKDLVISVRFLCPLNRKQSLCRNLLSLMLQDRCLKYSTKNKVTEALDDLYGASIASRTLTYGKAHMLEFRCKVLNEKFCATAHLEKQFELVHQFLFHPLFQQDNFKEAKDNYMDAIKRRMDKPSAYATNQAMLIMGKDTPLVDACMPSLSEIEQITLQDIKDAWQKMMTQDHITVQIQGEMAEDVIRRYVHRFLPFTNQYAPIECEYTIHQKELQETTETRHIDQTTLIMMFETNMTSSHPDFWKLRCANALFGQLPTSLLFQEVREKHALCYSIYSSIMSYEGCMNISTGISYENLKEAYQLIIEQFNRMKQGDFSEDDLNTAKMMLKDSVLSTADDMNATLNFNYQNLLLNQDRTLESCLKKIEDTTRQDVIDLFNRIEHKVTYVLKQEVQDETDM